MVPRNSIDQLLRDIDEILGVSSDQSIPLWFQEVQLINFSGTSTLRVCPDLDISLWLREIIHCSDDFRRCNFAPFKINDLAGETFSHAEMTKSGFVRLVLGK
jgi:hypothetical protein